MSFHQKRLAASKVLAIPKKDHKWVTKSSPGPHPARSSLPLLIAIRDGLGLCDTSKEARRIIGNREVSVDHRVVRDYKYSLGLMDTLSIPKTKGFYRVLLDQKGQLRLVAVEKKDAGWKLCRIENKTTLKGGKVQLNLHDGRNILVPKDEYKTGDTLKIELPTQKILSHYSLTKGAIGMVIGGAHTGEMSTVTERVPTRGSAEDLITFDDGFSTVKSHVFVVGTGKADVVVPEVSL